MANVSFKRGLQADLPNSNIVDGAFYLTTDTNRLYVGGANDKLELLNQSIKFYTYDQVFREDSTVPKVEGQFYYLSDKNILCTFAKTKTHPDGEWVQINPDHNDNTLVYVSGLNVTKSNSTEGNTKKLTYTIKLNQEKKESSDGGATPYGDGITASFEIDSNDLNKIASNVSVGLESKAIDNETNGFVLKNSGGGADDSKAVQIKGGDNVTITRAEDGNITIAATDTNTTYNLTSPVNSTNIMLNGGETGQVPTIVLSGDDKIIVEGESADQITFSHATSNVAAGDYNATNNYSAIDGNKISVPQFTVDATGHISNAGLKEITLPEDKDTTYKITNIDVVGTEGKTGKGKLSISLTDNNGGTKSTVSTGDVLYHNITIDGTDYTKYNQESLGEFYSTSKVDELITKAAANMNAMTYKGIINGDKFSGLKGSQNGDTYKASADFTINQQLVKLGDLVIYKGADLGATADPSTDDWDIVPSGNDIDSQFSLSLQEVGDKKTPTLTLRNTTINKDAGVVEVAGDKGIATIFDNGKLIIAHANESITADTVGENTNLTPAAADTIIVPSITYDAQGHITSAEDKAITLPADKDTTYTILTERHGTSDAAVKLKENGTETAGQSPTAVFKAGTSIVLDARSDGITIIHGDPDPNTATTNYGPNATGQVGYGKTFKVPKFSKDAKGHIVSVENVDITMPSEQDIPSVNFSGATEVDENNNRATFASTLVVGNDGKKQTYAPSIGSNTLKISGPDDNITIDLEWESF